MWELAAEHVKQIPHQESHYANKKSQKKYFENPALTVRTLFDLFKDYYKQKTNEDLKMNHKTYHMFFKHRMNYGFKLSRSDICDYCSECIVKLKSNPNDPCKISFCVHERKSSSSYAITY
jgi:hypothetical protein